MWFPTLNIRRVYSVVPNLRIRHRYDLPLVRRVGQNFLITCHRGIETNFAAGLGAGAKTAPAETEASMPKLGTPPKRAARGGAVGRLRTALATTVQASIDEEF